MKFRIFAALQGFDCPKWVHKEDMSWTEIEITTWSNSRKNAVKKVWNWAKKRRAIRRKLDFVNEVSWKTQHAYPRYYVR